MRILNVTETYAPFLEFGGPPVKVRALSEGLAQRNHAVTVLTADWGLDARFPELAKEEGADRSPFGWRLEENGVQSIYLPTWFRYRALTWNPAVKRYCRARLQNFDVVHIFGLYDLLGPAVAVACRAAKVPYVVEPIGMYVPIVRNVWLKRMYHAALGKRMLRGASALVATSEQEVQELAYGGTQREKIVLRRNGVESPKEWPERGKFRKSLKMPQEAKLILFLGRLSSKKSPGLLLEAFAKLFESSEGKDLRLVFAGPDESGMKAQLQQRAVQLRVSQRVMFSEAIFGETKWSAYRDADVFVLPSQNENFGNTAAEAVAAGTPVIVTDQCGVAPLLANVAGLVVAHEVSELSGALGKILEDEALHTKLAGGCAEVAARLGWSEPVEEMEGLYKKLARAESVVTEFRGVE